MCLTRKKSKMPRMWCTLFVATGLGGCAVKHPPPADPISHSPLVVDEAMQLREWPVSVAHYENGATPGLATTFLLINRPDAPIWTATVTETPIFAFNSFASAVVLICSPPWQRIIYPSGGIEPSYNAMPPLPAK
jgi:hypothetical protein